MGELYQRKIYTYCEVLLQENGNIYYYRTRNTELKVEDVVCVPFGYNYENKIGKIVSMKDYKGYKAPYPLKKTKYIKGKCSLDKWFIKGAVEMIVKIYWRII